MKLPNPFILNKHLGKSKYKNVYICQDNKGNFIYRAKIGNPKSKIHFNYYFNDEIEAAKAIDLILIRFGKEPVNILKAK